MLLGDATVCSVCSSLTEFLIRTLLKFIPAILVLWVRNWGYRLPVHGMSEADHYSADKDYSLFEKNWFVPADLGYYTVFHTVVNWLSCNV